MMRETGALGGLFLADYLLPKMFLTNYELLRI